MFKNVFHPEISLQYCRVNIFSQIKQETGILGIVDTYYREPNLGSFPSQVNAQHLFAMTMSMSDHPMDYGDHRR